MARRGPKTEAVVRGLLSFALRPTSWLPSSSPLDRLTDFIGCHQFSPSPSPRHIQSTMLCRERRSKREPGILSLGVALPVARRSAHAAWHTAWLRRVMLSSRRRLDKNCPACHDRDYMRNVPDEPGQERAPQLSNLCSVQMQSMLWIKSNRWSLPRLRRSERAVFQAWMSKDVQNTARKHMLRSLPSTYVTSM